MTPLFPLAIAFLSTTTTAFTTRPFLSTISTRHHTKMSASNFSSLPPLLTPTGEPLPPSSLPSLLAGKRIALYFSAGWCPMCTSFEPSLVQFIRACNNAGDDRGVVQLLYIPSDRSREAALSRATDELLEDLNLLSVPFGPHAEEMKRKYKIWAGSECGSLGRDRRSGVPALVVLDSKGEEMAFLGVESLGVKALEGWDLGDGNGVW